MSSQILTNKVYLKTFLIDHTLAMNGMRLVKANNLQKFVGKELILTPNKDHPPEFRKYKQTGIPHVDIPNFLKLQNRYRIGKIIEVNQSLVQGNDEPVYSALIELDTTRGINLYRHRLLPKYVSVSLYQTKGDGWADIQDFEALHLALVNDPAYGVTKARVRGSCEDSLEICRGRLAQAHLIQANWETRKKHKRTKLEELKAVIEHTTGRRI